MTGFGLDLFTYNGTPEGVYTKLFYVKSHKTIKKI